MEVGLTGRCWWRGRAGLRKRPTPSLEVFAATVERMVAPGGQQHSLRSIAAVGVWEFSARRALKIAVDRGALAATAPTISLPSQGRVHSSEQLPMQVLPILLSMNLNGTKPRYPRLRAHPLLRHQIIKTEPTTLDRSDLSAETAFVRILSDVCHFVAKVFELKFAESRRF